MSQWFAPPKAWGLTPLEARVLNIMLGARNVASKAAIWDELYSQQSGGGPEPKIIDVLVCTLRRKLRRHLDSQPIQTVWGQGYRIEETDKALIREIAIATPEPESLVSAPPRAEFAEVQLTRLQALLASHLIDQPLTGYAELGTLMASWGSKCTTSESFRKHLSLLRRKLLSTELRLECVFGGNAEPGYRIVRISQQERAA